MILTRRHALRTFLLALGALAATSLPAAAGVRTVDSPGLRALLESTPAEVFVLDVRTPGEWSRGHLAEAHLIPMNQVPDRLGEIPRDRKVVVVCASGARSAAVARFLDQQGYPWVANHEGGVFDWSRRGLPLAR